MSQNATVEGNHPLLRRAEIRADDCLRAERMVKFGMDEHEHALLVKALDTARRVEEDAVGEAETLGLG